MHATLRPLRLRVAVGLQALGLVELDEGVWAISWATSTVKGRRSVQRAANGLPVSAAFSE